MKQCGKCKKTKNEDEFSFKVKPKRQSYCRECQKVYRRKNHLKNKDKYLKQKEVRRQRNMDFVISYLLKHPCVDCDESDIVVLDFDHRNNKRDGVPKMARDGVSLETLKREIDKCDVRCANCHRRKTSKQFDWYKCTI